MYHGQNFAVQSLSSKWLSEISISGTEVSFCLTCLYLPNGRKTIIKEICLREGFVGIVAIHIPLTIHTKIVGFANSEKILKPKWIDTNSEGVELVRNGWCVCMVNGPIFQCHVTSYSYYICYCNLKKVFYHHCWLPKLALDGLIHATFSLDPWFDQSQFQLVHSTLI